MFLTDSYLVHLLHRTRKIVHQSHARRINSSVLIYGSVLKRLTNAMEFPTVMMARTNSAVHRWNQISAIRKNISAVKLQEFVFLSLGIVMAPTTAMIIPTKKIVDRFHVQTTFTSARTQNAFSRLTFVMAKTIAATIPTNLMNMLVWRLLSVALLVNGSAQKSPLVVST